MSTFELSGVVTVSCHALIEAESEEEAIERFLSGEFEADQDGESRNVVCEEVD